VRIAIVTALSVTAVASAGCGAIGRVDPSSGDPGVGKALFVEKCGACHTLADAKTTGTVGPNLDDAFAADKDQGFHLSTIADVVRGQIAYPETDPGQVVDPDSMAPSPGMTPNLVQGQQARDVSVYVAKCAANPSCGVTAASLPESGG
jgi:mono/diheme cytochrome c family protein